MRTMKRWIPKDESVGRCSILAGIFRAAWPALVALAPWAAAQTQPSLGLQLSAGRPVLSITGSTGAVFAIQCASDLAQSNAWVTLTNLTVPSSPFLFQDKTAPSVGNRFYRLQAQGAGNGSPTNPNPAAFVWIGPGTFIMGSPPNEAERYVDDETQHRVTLTRGFFMAKYLVTQQDYLDVTRNNPSYFLGDLTLPVETVSWEDATNYCLLRTQQEQAAGLIPSNYVYRLPTEAEWEVRLPGGNDDGILPWQRPGLGPGELRWPIRV